MAPHDSLPVPLPGRLTVTSYAHTSSRSAALLYSRKQTGPQSSASDVTSKNIHVEDMEVPTRTRSATISLAIMTPGSPQTDRDKNPTRISAQQSEENPVELDHTLRYPAPVSYERSI